MKELAGKINKQLLSEASVSNVGALVWITGKYCRGTDADPISLSLGSWLVAMRALDSGWEEGSEPNWPPVNLMLYLFYSNAQYTAFFVQGTPKEKTYGCK